MRYSRFIVLLFLLISIGSHGTYLSALTSGSSGEHRPSQNPASKKISKWVIDKFSDGGQVEFLVVLSDQADLSPAYQLKTKKEKGRYVFNALKETARRSQGPILEWLEARKIEHRSFYIVNTIWVKGTQDVALDLSRRSEVERIEGNPQLNGLKPLIPDRSEFPDEKLIAQSIEAGVRYIRAPEVWEMGFKGSGIVIGGQDTGVRWDHPALLNRYRGWTDMGADHNYNWHDSIHTEGSLCGSDSKVPCDDHNHGTHTLGTAVGTDGGVNQIGVAPGAKFIACRNMDRGNGTPATYLECFEFFLAPYPVNGTPDQGDPDKAPDITTNSWTCPPEEGCEPLTLQRAVEVQRAAGIMTIAAAGNGGPACSTVVDPPAIYDASYTVGALNSATDALAAFSSRGPVNLSGSIIIKPDIAAPGVAVRSAMRNGDYATLNGTSMATPHVAGAAALLWSAFPDLRGQVDLTENIINESAIPVERSDCESNIAPNNLFGFGRLDVKAAFDLAATRIEPSEIIFGINGGSGSIKVEALPGVKWRVRSKDNWITVTSGSEGMGVGMVHFLVGSNSSTSRRSGSLTIAGREVSISQPGYGPLYAVSGRITDFIGRGIARVRLEFSRIGGGGEIPDRVETDDNGYWRQSGFEPGTTYRVKAIRSRINFSPSHYDFSGPNATMNFSSIGRLIAPGIRQ